MGWTAAHVQPEVEAAVAEGEVDALVVALGTNDSGVGVGLDGWSPADVELFRQLIALPGPEACVVIVLPGSGDGIDPAHAVEMDEARFDLISLAEQRGEVEGGGPTVVVDWQATIDAHPELIAEDGIHFAVDPTTNQASPTAAAARTTLYWQGVDACTTR